MSKEKWISYIIIAVGLVSYMLLYWTSQKIALNFSGDSIQYMGMAYKVQHFEIPYSDKWMPFYPIVIGFFTWFGINLFTSVSIVNALFLIGVILICYRIVINIVGYKPFVLILLSVILVTNRELYMNSMTIMAELPLLFFILLYFLFIVPKLSNERGLSYKETIILSLISVLAIFTKYNAITLVGLTVMFMFFNKHQRNKIKNILLYVLILGLPYLTWTLAKPGKDMLVAANNSVTETGFMQNLILNLHDSLIAGVGFFTIPKFELVVQNLNAGLVSIIIVISLTAMGYYIVKSYLSHGVTRLNFILSFVVLYFIAFIYGSSMTGINETNQRTLFYPLFIIELLLFIILIKSNRVVVKSTLAILFIGITGFGFLKVNQTNKRFVTQGYGDLSKEYFRNENGVFAYSINKCKELGLNRSEVFSNRHKLVGIYFGFIQVEELPTNRQWLGNKQWFESDNKSIVEVEQLFSKIEHNRKGLILYVGSDYESMLSRFYTTPNPSFQTELFEDGFVIYYKKQID